MTTLPTPTRRERHLFSLRQALTIALILKGLFLLALAWNSHRQKVTLTPVIPSANHSLHAHLFSVRSSSEPRP